MATAKQTPDVDKVTTPTQGGRRDHIVLPSITKDGRIAEHDPVLIGEKEFTREAVREQFRQNAVAGADDEYRLEKAAAAGAAEEVEQDPEIQARIDEHEKVAGTAEKAADKVVDQLHEG